MMQCLPISKIMMIKIDRFSKTGYDEIDQACWVSNHDFRTEIIKKLTGVVRQVLTCPVKITQTMHYWSN